MEFTSVVDTGERKGRSGREERRCWGLEMETEVEAERPGEEPPEHGGGNEM